VTPVDILDDLVVVELATGIAGPHAGKMFADAGARVIKIEPPGGDPLRRRVPPGVDPRNADSALFQHLNAGKESAIGAPGEKAVEDLVARADLVIESFTPEDRVVAAWRSRYPGLVVLSITPYGRAGPWQDRPATGFTLQAQSGSIGFRGRPDEPPFQAGGRLAEWAGGVFGSVGALAAVLRSRTTGAGEHVDCSLLAADHLITNPNACLRASFLGHPETGEVARIIDVPSIERTADGYIGFNTNTSGQLAAFLEMVGRPDLLAGDPNWVSADYRLRNARKFNDAVRPWIAQRTTAEVTDLAAKARIPVAPVNNGATLPRQDQFTRRGVIGPMPGGEFVHPMPPFVIDGQRPQITRPAPALGSGAELPPSRPAARPTANSKAAADSGRLPLAGLRVLDATAMWAGPTVGLLFAALGADVIHLESVQRLDLSRLKVDNAARAERWWERGHTWFMMNFNKRDITLDLGRPAGRELLAALLPSCDVLVENYSPRVFEKFGLTPDRVRELNPDLVFARMPAFGLDGPWRDYIGFAQTMESMSGLAWLTGPAGGAAGDGGAPVVPRGPCDPLAGYQAAFAILLALIRRARGSGGCLVEAAMAESAVNIAAESIVDFSAYGYLHERTGNRSPDAAPQGLYECGPERWLAISVADDAQWTGLKQALGGPAWADDPSLDAAAGRHAQHDELDERLAEWATGQDLDSAAGLLLVHGVPAATVADPRRMDSNPQLRHWGYFEAVDHEILGRHYVPTFPFRFAGIDRWVRTAAPRLGEHNEEVLGELGLDATAIDRLRADGVIGNEPLAGNPSFVL
jgi:crotonobetainyl-CoA:carnitine CoA-transferase CaiB-like acyl-CoA transferase